MTFKQFMATSGLTAQQAAIKLRCSVQTVYNLIDGSAWPTRRLMMAIKKLTKNSVTVSDIYKL